MRPLGVQVVAIAYRTGEAWNEAAYSNPDLDEKIGEALAIADAEKRKAVMADIEKILQDSASSSSLTGASSTTTRCRR